MSGADKTDDFRQLRRIRLVHTSGAELVIDEQIGGEGVDADQARQQIAEFENRLGELRAFGWNIRERYDVPAYRVEPEPEPKPNDPAGHYVRLDACVERLREAGIGNAALLSSCPAGWLRVVEVATDGLVALVKDVGRHGADGTSGLRITDFKEKFGTLRMALYGELAFPQDACLRACDIINWAESSTNDRCMVTGGVGEVTGPGWLLTLSPAMRELRKVDQAALMRLIYPDRPEPEASDPSR